MSIEVGKQSIKFWAEDDRPREKLLLKGKAALSDAELIAILLGSGSRNETAVELAQRILSSVNNNLAELGTLTVNDLMKFKGIGEAKAISIVAALEVGRRRGGQELDKKPKVTSSKIAFQYVYPDLADLPHEEFWILLLNRANHIIHKVKISEGGVAGTVADGKIIFRHAIEKLASAIILVHNHPSGNLTPSPQDIDLTKKLSVVGKCIDLQIIDHIIIAGNSYKSFSDEGLLS
jgi:DNA repair protein RadC